MNGSTAIRGIIGICSHGLLGNLFSNSMNSLAASLNAATPAGVHFYVEGGNNPNLHVSEIESVIDQGIAAGKVPVLIGHSLGADLVVQESRRLKNKGIAVPLVGAVDPVDWTGNGSPIVIGVWEVDDNVGLVINPRQDSYPGGGRVVRSHANTVTAIHDMHMPQYPHAAIFGYDIGSCPETQHAIITAVQTIVAQQRQA